ncbi:hypothetical protein [Streptomyces flaveolus]
MAFSPGTTYPPWLLPDGPPVQRRHPGADPGATMVSERAAD